MVEICVSIVTSRRKNCYDATSIL